MEIGKRIKEIRESISMTQSELADKLDLSVHTVSKYEQGQRKPKLDMIQKIAKALEVSVNELLGIDTAFSPTQGELLQTLIVNKSDERMREYVENTLSAYDFLDIVNSSNLSDSNKSAAVMAFNEIKYSAHHKDDMINTFLRLCELLSLDVQQINRNLLLDCIDSPIFKAFLNGIIEVSTKEGE